MASASTSLSDDQFTCSICLDLFTEPVSTPCGHNYCRDCITSYWEACEFSQCPLCKETFCKRPVLRVNTGFREVVEHFKKIRALDSHDSSLKPGQVACDVCTETKLKAVKSCLVCLVSFCPTHLEPHQRVTTLKRHKLINPVGNLEKWMCRKHDKVVEFFCRRDQTCVCAICLKDDHVMHETVSLEEESAERKARLGTMKTEMNQRLNMKRLKVIEVEKSIPQGQSDTKRAKVDIGKAFSALETSIKTYKVKLVELLEEKQRAAEQQAEGFTKHLYLEITELQKKSDELEELTNTEDHLQLLQSPPPVFAPSDTKDWTRIRNHSLQHVETMKRAVGKLEETLRTEMERVISDISQVDDSEEVVENSNSSETESLLDDELGQINRQYSVDVTLDPDTAHPCLILSHDGKQVRDGGAKRNLPDSPKRFDFFHFVLGKEGFPSGRFYYEVQVKGQAGWEVGVVRESINRKGIDVSLSPENGCWTMGLYWGRYQANTNPPVALTLMQEPQKIGVFVDYEGGEVSFYDLDTRVQIYSFTHCTFTPSVPLLMNLLQAYTGSHTKNKIYPFFRPGPEDGRNSAPLQILPVRPTKPGRKT